MCLVFVFLCLAAQRLLSFRLLKTVLQLSAAFCLLSSFFFSFTINYSLNSSLSFANESLDFIYHLKFLTSSGF